MSSDSQAVALIIQMMPLMTREFQVKLDPELLVSDRTYADTVIGLAGQEPASDRLRSLAGRLRERLAHLAAGPSGGLRSESASAGASAAYQHPEIRPEPAPHDAPASEGRAKPEAKYVRTLR